MAPPQKEDMTESSPLHKEAARRPSVPRGSKGCRRGGGIMSLSRFLGLKNGQN